MLQGSWWLTVTQFCIEGLMVEGAKGEATANRFAETMLEEVHAQLPTCTHSCPHAQLGSVPIPPPPPPNTLPLHHLPARPLPYPP